jgi:opacity protein-like surface antigen
MKKTLVACSAAALLMTTVSAHAIGVSAQVGEHYRNVGVGLGTTTPGLALSGQWTQRDHRGDVAGVGLGYNIKLGPALATVGGKLLYVNPKHGKDGYAAPLGGGLQLPINNYVSLYGEGYYAPNVSSSHIKNYKEASAGVRFTPISLVSIDVGYRYEEMAGKGYRPNEKLADGMYIGGAVNF